MSIRVINVFNIKNYNINIFKIRNNNHKLVTLSNAIICNIYCKHLSTTRTNEYVKKFSNN